MAVTNRGKKLILEYAFGRTAIPASFHVALLTSASAPTVDTNVMSDHTQISTGNGYSDGGYTLTTASPNTSNFDNSSENDTANSALIQIKDIVWTASTGPIPASGGGARYAVLTDYNATVGDRQIIAYWDLTSDRTVSDGQTLTLQNLEIDATEPA